MSTINMVKYYFYRGMLPENQQRLRDLIALAYQTARDRKLYPKAILIRSNEHSSTSQGGIYKPDPLGWHVTLCFKDDVQLASNTHVASHGYVKGKGDLTFLQATHSGVKPDSHLKSSGKPVWPSEMELDVAPEIGYGHFPSAGSG
ncbi:hypothetical protein DTO013E5_9993 [Penicillium roqueforti]|nr:hypothetical protein DTO012A1_10026 [Penicillium roqueforti]KAI2735927.1 hypothetical protein DTO013F2_10046 [Penicillium roqueforti]KAI3196903.1 hypothetical protein DTO013E5_9993 [Penicillium roqueforti]